MINQKFKFQSQPSAPFSFRFQTSCILAFIISVSLHLPAQISQQSPYERPHKGNDFEFIVISMADKGIALIRDTEKFENGKKRWEVILIDTALNESWATKIDVDQRMNILGHDYRDGNVYLIFEEPETTGHKVSIFEILTSDKSIKQHVFKSEVNMRFTHFSVVKNKAVFGGYITKEPALLMYDLTSETTKVIPGIFQTKIELMDVRTNSNDTFNALLVERDSKANKNLVVRTFDTQGVLLVDDVIKIDDDKSIIEAITGSLIHDELIIVGTWTYGTSKQASGIFSVLVDPFNEQKVNYYDFADLDHILDYLKPKRIARIKAKAKWRKSVGKQTEFRAQLNPVRIEENKDGFSFLTEVYDPSNSYYNPRWGSPYGYNSNSYYGPYGYSPYAFNSMPYRYYNSPYGYNPYTNNSNASSDTRMIHSSLSFFDIHGKLVSDQSLKFSEIKLNSKSQVSDFILTANQTIMVCKEEKEIIVQVNKSNEASKEEKILPALKSPSETVRTELHENSGIRFWYGRNFYVYGYHTIRDNAEKTSRDVFYINKIRVD